MYRKLLPLVLVFLLWLELPVILACPPTPTPVPSPIDTPTPEPTLPPLSTPVRPTPTNEPTPVPLPVIVTPKPKPKHTPVPPASTPIMLLPITGAEATPMLRKYPVVDIPWSTIGYLVVAVVSVAVFIFAVAPYMLSSQISQREEGQRLLAELKLSSTRPEIDPTDQALQNSGER